MLKVVKIRLCFVEHLISMLVRVVRYASIPGGVGTGFNNFCELIGIPLDEFAELAIQAMAKVESNRQPG